MKAQEKTKFKTEKEKELAIYVKELSFTYRKRKEKILALHHINLEIYRGETVAIAGPNGGGKTTFIKHLNGLNMPQEGSIKILNEELNPKTRNSIRKKVGLVFQNPEEQLFFPMVKDDILFGPRNMKLSNEEQNKRLINSLERVESLHLLERVNYNLSFGEKKRVALAGILAMNPEILVLDEPTAGIDPWVKPKFIEIITSIKENQTLVLVSHDFELLKKVDRIICFVNGQIKGEYNSFQEFYEDNF